jgi:hypothetical protein
MVENTRTMLIVPLFESGTILAPGIQHRENRTKILSLLTLWLTLLAQNVVPMHNELHRGLSLYSG